jgi:hypothetical protein
MSFRVVYPGKGRVTFDGGMNSKFTRDVIGDNESPDCKNVRFGNGSVETRGGSARVNTAPIGSFVGDSLYVRHVDTGSETMVAFAGGTAWYLQGTSFITIPSAQSLFTAGTRFGAAEYENNLFVGNGGTIPYKYNGDFTRHGIYPPTSTSTVASQATGVLTGDYRYKIVNLNSGLVESDVGPGTATFTAASATLRVSLQTFAASYRGTTDPPPAARHTTASPRSQITRPQATTIILPTHRLELQHLPMPVCRLSIGPFCTTPTASS